MTIGTEIAEAYIKIRPNTKGFASDVENDVQGALTKIRKTALGVIGGAAALSFVRGGLDELKEQAAVLAQTDAVIRSTGGAANVTAGHVKDLAAASQELSGKDAELVQKGENLLLTFKAVANQAGEGNDIFNRATQTALDLSVAFGQDMTQSSILLGKALEDPVAGLTALRRVGITFSESQRAVITGLVQSGHLLEAQKLILRELESQVGGSAKAYGETLPGKLERAGNAFDDLKAAVVGSAAPALEKGAESATTLADAFSSLPEGVQGLIVKQLALAVASKPLKAIFDQASASAKALKASFVEAGGGASGFAAGASKLAKGGVIVLGIQEIIDGVEKLKDVAKTGAADFRKGLPDPSDIDGYIAGVNRGVEESNKLTEQIRELSGVAEPGQQSLAQMGQQAKSAGEFFANAVTGGRAFDGSIEQLQSRLNGLNAELEIETTRAAEMGARVKTLATDLGVSGTAVKDFVSQFAGLDITQVTVEKLEKAFREAQKPGADLAAVAEILGVKVRTAGTDATEAAARYRDLRDAFFGAQDASRAVTDATQSLADAQRSESDAAQGALDALRNERLASEATADAVKSHARDLKDQAAALDEVRVAEQELAAARAGATKQDQLKERGAALSVTAAEIALAKARREHLPAKERRLRIDEAQLALDEAKAAKDRVAAELAGRVGEAEQKLLTAQEKLLSAEETSARSAKAIEDARYAQARATDSVTQANLDVARAHRDTEKAEYDLFKASEILTQKQDDLAIAFKDDGDQLRTFLDHLTALRDQAPQTAAVLDPLISKLNTVLQLEADQREAELLATLTPEQRAQREEFRRRLHDTNRTTTTPAVVPGTGGGYAIPPPGTHTDQNGNVVNIVHNYNGVSIEEAQRQADQRDRRHLSLLAGA